MVGGGEKVGELVGQLFDEESVGRGGMGGEQ